MSEETSKKMKTVVVTGGGGFIGSHCVLALVQENFDVVVVDNLVNCSFSGPRQEPNSLMKIQQLTGKMIAFERVDLCDISAVRSIFNKYHVDGVIHCAALKAVGESRMEPIRYFNNNVASTTILLKVMEEHKVQKLVFSSSSCVYGDPKYLPIDEKHPTGNCTNPYGKSKYFCEEILKDVCAANEAFGVVILRYFNPVGAHPSGEIGEEYSGKPNNLAPYITSTAQGKLEKLTVFGQNYNTPDGTAIRDYIHIMDLVDGHVAALKKLLNPSFSGLKVYNFATGRGVSVLEMVQAFETVTGLKIPYEFGEPRSGDVACSYAISNLAEKELGWKARYTLHDMCSHMWTFAQKQDDKLKMTT